MIDAIPYTDFGGDGPILHFAHPNAYPPEAFLQFCRPLTAAFHVVSQWNRALWPGSDPAEMDDWALIGDDLIRFLDQQEYRNVVGVGHSLGGVATLYAAVKRPQLFRRLVFIDPVFLPPEVLTFAAANPEARGFKPMVDRALKRRNHWQTRQAAFDRYRRKPVFKRFSDQALWDYVNAATVDAPAGGVSLRFPREWEAQYYSLPPLWVWEYVAQLAQPTLAIRATESDTLFSVAWAEWQQRQPGATFVEVPDVSHMLIMERPDDVAQIVLQFVANASTV